MSDVSGMPEPGGLSRIPFTVAAENQIKSLSFWLTVIGWLNVVAAATDILNLVLPQRNLGLIVNLILYVAIAPGRSRPPRRSRTSRRPTSPTRPTWSRDSPSCGASSCSKGS